MSKLKAPAPHYMGPAAHTSGKGNLPIHRIVIHMTVSPCREGQARETARYFQSPKARGSAHYIVDPGEVIQSVYDSVIAWHAPPNTHSLGVELCGYPSPWNVKWWDSGAPRRMERRAARLVAELCAFYGVPPYFVGVVRLKRGAHGVTTHANVSKAFRQSSHWDPGVWRRVRFMREVRRQVKLVKAGK